MEALSTQGCLELTIRVKELSSAAEMIVILGQADQHCMDLKPSPFSVGDTISGELRLLFGHFFIPPYRYRCASRVRCRQV